MNKLISGLLLSGALLIGAVVPTVANADTTANTGGQTTVSAGFIKNTTSVTPVDPSNPDTPSGGGDDNNGAAAGGDLSLIYVTNKLDFGTHQIDVLSDKTYTASQAADTNSDGDVAANTDALWNGKAVVEVSDVRGTNAGWTLGVTGSQLTNGSDTLTGAKLALPDGSVTNSGDTTNGATAASTTNVIGATATVLSATNGNGAGVTVDQLDPSGITLTVPANVAKAKAYTGTLTWSLSDTPAS